MIKFLENLTSIQQLAEKKNAAVFANICKQLDLPDRIKDINSNKTLSHIVNKDDQLIQLLRKNEMIKAEEEGLRSQAEGIRKSNRVVSTNQIHDSTGEITKLYDITFDANNLVELNSVAIEDALIEVECHFNMDKCSNDEIYDSGHS